MSEKRVWSQKDRLMEIARHEHLWEDLDALVEVLFKIGIYGGGTAMSGKDVLITVKRRVELLKELKKVFKQNEKETLEVI